MKIAFVGASGYGNVGDDTYPLVFREHLPEHEVIVFNSDRPADLPDDLGLLVLGGGGLIYNSNMVPPTAESDHFRAMKFYLDRALARGVPFGFSSCGIQFAEGQGVKNPVALTPWIPYLKQARFLTLRSPVCTRLAAELTGRSDVRFFPDAAYLLRPPPCEKSDTLVVVPAGVINVRDMFVQHFIRPFDSLGWELVWMSMGASHEDDPVLADARRKYPHARVIARPAPREALTEIARARFVLSGRFHGLVFARRSGVPFFTPQDSPHKILVEDLTVNPALAAGHLEVLRDALAAL